jgi:hypothetical protein
MSLILLHELRQGDQTPTEARSIIVTGGEHMCIAVPFTAETLMNNPAFMLQLPRKGSG